MWEVEVTDEFIACYDGLADDDSGAVDIAVEWLMADGPTPGRP